MPPQEKSPIPLRTWLLHRHSKSMFQVLKIHALHVETLDDHGEKGYANRYILERDLRLKVYVIDRGKGKG